MNIEEPDDSAYISAKENAILSPEYFKFLEWDKKGKHEPFTRVQSLFVNWLLEEPQINKLRQIGDLDIVFTKVRRYLKGHKPL